MAAFTSQALHTFTRTTSNAIETTRPGVPHIRRAHISALKLRPHKETCLGSCLDAPNDGSAKIGVLLPTGAGKTMVFMTFLERLQALSGNPEATRSLVIVNSVELVRQVADQAWKLLPYWAIEIEQGARYTASGFASVRVEPICVQPSALIFVSSAVATSQAEVNPSSVWEERSSIGVLSHIPALCELRDARVSQTHTIAPRRIS